jgi:hypothetical protein
MTKSERAMKMKDTEFEHESKRERESERDRGREREEKLLSYGLLVLNQQSDQRWHRCGRQMAGGQ